MVYFVGVWLAFRMFFYTQNISLKQVVDEAWAHLQQCQVADTAISDAFIVEYQQLSSRRTRNGQRA